MTTPDILQLLLRSAEDMNPSLTSPIDIKKGADAALFGPQGALDSMGLVRFVGEIEAVIEDETGVSVVLASERAMSQRRSPFLTIGSLAAYVEDLLKEQETQA
jgi:D-alanine--poly(phosphoribitol) ligase subunit 2